MAHVRVAVVHHFHVCGGISRNQCACLLYTSRVLVRVPSDMVITPKGGYPNQDAAKEMCIRDSPPAH